MQIEDSFWCHSAEVIVTTTIDELTEQAMQLSFEERAELADRLFRSLEPPGDDVSTSEWAAAWLPELERRVQAYERGESVALERVEAMAAIRESFRKRRQP